eukprot:3654001-Amphidinium_carterae.1
MKVLHLAELVTVAVGMVPFEQPGSHRARSFCRRWEVVSPSVAYKVAYFREAVWFRSSNELRRPLARWAA